MLRPLLSLAFLLLTTAPLAAEEAPAAPTVALEATPAPTPETAALSISLKAKDPGNALSAAFWPGILLHGWGHREAGDNNTFLSLAGGELFGAIILGFGLAEALGPDIKGESKATSQAMAMGGGAVMATTWLWDLLGASSAAKKYNFDHGLSLLPAANGAQLALRF